MNQIQLESPHKLIPHLFEMSQNENKQRFIIIYIRNMTMKRKELFLINVEMIKLK